MTRINNVVKELDSKETLLDQFDIDFVTDDLEEVLSEDYNDEDPMDLTHWAAGLNSRY